ncbi:hypothetical protein KFL_013080020 [Klebsormidium nitens]|uniref:Uncharacterized protein n=1 Tax=Klebsormidium nitens TaxID=105231 RepID=A0A1Y1IQD0_KLENI|nr:hypothetical protein KFL_013080020 [Klebsormidium nitens]|eukprot:GAQ93115.1 hypothetical protein KFL_013080020 [Klebsormidium nitens]
MSSISYVDQHFPVHLSLVTAKDIQVKTRTVSERGKGGLRNKPTPSDFPDWKMVLQCEGPRCKTMLLVGGYFEWQLASTGPADKPFYKASLSETVFVWSELTQGMRLRAGSKAGTLSKLAVGTLPLGKVCTHRFNPKTGLGLGYSVCRGVPRRELTDSLNPSLKGNTRQTQIIGEMSHAEVVTGNNARVGRTGAVARKAASEVAKKKRPGGEDEVAGLRQLRERYILEDKKLLGPDEAANERHVLGFVKGISSEPFMITCFHAAMLIMLRWYGKREEGVFIDSIGHQVKDLAFLSSKTGLWEICKRLVVTIVGAHPGATDPRRIKSENYPPVVLMKGISSSENSYNLLMAMFLLLQKEQDANGNNVPICRIWSDCSDMIMGVCLTVMNKETREDYVTRMARLLLAGSPFPENRTIHNWCNPHAMAANSRWGKYDLKGLDGKVDSMPRDLRVLLTRYLLAAQELLTIAPSFPLLVQWIREKWALG